MPRAITIVPKPPKLEQKKRVAAYARVCRITIDIGQVNKKDEG